MAMAALGRRSSSRQPAVSPQLALEVLELVEDLPGGATGALVFGPREQPHGTVLVEAGRVCWATAAGMRRRLTDLLRKQATPPVDRATIEAVYARARSESLPLGEAMVESGLLSVTGLQLALRAHTAEALMAIGGRRAQPAWIAHRRKRYDARFTFTPAELLACAGAAVYPDLAEAASEELGLVLALEGSGIAFARAAGFSGPLPVALVRAVESGVRDLSKLGRWGFDMLDVSGALAPGAPLVGAIRDDGTALVVWSAGRIVHVALCDDPSSLAGVIVRRARMRA